MIATGNPRWRPLTAPAALILGVLVALVAGSILLVAAVGTRHQSLANAPAWVTIVASLIQDLALVGAAVLFAASVARPTPGQFGLRPTSLRRGAALVVGTYVAFLVFSAIWISVLRLHEHEQVLKELGANTSTLGLLVAAAFTCVVAPICEELFFRGYFFSAIRNRTGVWPAAAVTGIVFGAVHTGSAPAGYLLPLAVLGFALCLIYSRSGSLYPCIALHALNNSIAFGGMEHWGWQIPVLVVAAYGAIALVVGGLTRVWVAR